MKMSVLALQSVLYFCCPGWGNQARSFILCLKRGKQQSDPLGELVLS